jgi:hypothetical protein
LDVSTFQGEVFAFKGLATSASSYRSHKIISQKRESAMKNDEKIEYVLLVRVYGFCSINHTSR